MRIKVLDAATAGQIAAGEVVERPASAAKELVENALDAGARQIDVSWDGTALTVSDDGEGMERADVPLALRRHATSKIRDIGDLQRLHTLGFRGEALPAIAAVSRLRIVTRRAEDAAATVATCAGGEPPVIADGAAPPGTTVEVRDLFFNTPARRAALRSPQAESAAIAEVVRAAAFAHPRVAFTLTLHGREALRTPGSGRLEDVAAAVWGGEVARALLAVRGRDAGVLLAGLVGRPEAARGGRGDQYVAVNGRPVRAEVVRGAVEAAFRGLLALHRFPLFVLHLTLDPAAVDVNVHPRKADVRFAAPEAVRRLCFHAVRAALAGTELVRELPLPHPTPAADLAEAPQALHLPLPPPGETPPGAPEPAAAPLPELRPLGQLAASYVLAEGPDGLYVLDQHAAHERVFFEAFARQEIPRQLLLRPIAVELPAAPAELGLAGFELEPFGGGTWLLRAVPADLAGAEPEAALRDFLERLRAEPGAEPPQRRAMRALAACKAAVKAGERLGPEAMRALLAALAACRQPYTCPHGRPTLLRLSYGELRRHFGRS